MMDGNSQTCCSGCGVRWLGHQVCMEDAEATVS